MPRFVLVPLLLVCILMACTPTDAINVRQRDQHQMDCNRFLMANDHRRATAACQMCLEYARADPECTHMMGMIHFSAGRFEEARGWYKRAMRYRNDFPRARNSMGVLLMVQDEDYPRAITLFESALKIDPGYGDARWNLALAHSRLGTLEHIKAVRYLGGADLGGLEPHAVQALFQPAEDHYAVAAMQADRLLQVSATDARAPGLLAFIEMQRAQYTTVETHRREHLRQSEAWARQCVEMAVVDSAQARECRGNLAAVLERQWRCGEAEAMYGQCLSYAPHDPSCLAGAERAHACATAAQTAKP